MDHRGVQTWLDRYIEPWRTADAAAIAQLFGRDAEYRFHPADDPIVGPKPSPLRGSMTRTSPASWDAWYQPFLVEGDRARRRPA